MFEVIAIVAVALAIAIAVILILAATKPDTFSVRRATTVKAPPEKLFPLIKKLRESRPPLLAEVKVSTPLLAIGPSTVRLPVPFSPPIKGLSAKLYVTVDACAGPSI